MPELPEVTIYVERLRAMVQGQQLSGVRIASPFLLRTVDPPVAALHGRILEQVGRVGKRIMLRFEDDLFAVIHLMIAGRLRWRGVGAKLPKRNGLAAFDFASGTLLLTEAGSKRRASLHVVFGEAALADFDRGGVDVLGRDTAEFGRALRATNRTLKRALTDPSIVDGVGNAYSDEILHQAGLSPFKLTKQMTDDDLLRLHEAARAVLSKFIARQRDEVGAGFPDKVSAFRDDMAVHGKYRQPCPTCGAPVQRISYAENEANYCARCQTGGRLLADRALSRLLKQDWPKTLDDLERIQPGGSQ